MRRLLVPLLLLALPAAAQLRLSPERAVSAPTLVPKHGLESVSPTTFDTANAGDLGLIVWEDSRARLQPAIFAARINAAGEVLDPAGIPLVAYPTTTDVRPNVVWRADAQRFLVTWTRLDAANNARVMAAEVDRDGNHTEPNAIAIGYAGDLMNQVTPFGDRTYGIVQQLVNGVLSKTEVGLVTKDSFVPTTDTIPATYSAHLASLGDGFLLAFLRPGAVTNDPYVLRLDEQGRPVGSITRIDALSNLPKGSEELIAGSSGRDAIVIVGGRDGIGGARIKSDGGVQLLNGFPPSTGYHLPLDVIEGEDGRFEVLRMVKTSLQLSAFTDDGLAANIDFTTNARAAKGLRFDKRTLVLFESPTNETPGTIWGEWVGNPTRFPIVQSAQNQTSPALATNGSSVYAVWVENRGAARDVVMGAPLTRDGIPSAAPSAIIDNGKTERSPAIVWDGAGYLIVVQEAQTLIARRIAAVSDIAVAFDLASLSTADASPRVASNGQNALAVWNDDATRAALITRGNTFPVTVEGRGFADVAWNGETYAVIAETASVLRLTRVSSGGNAQGSADLGAGKKPAIAWGSDSHLVVFERDNGIFGALLHRDGSRIGGDVVISPAGSQPRVTWDGGSFVVVWRDGSDAFLKRVYANGTTSAAIPVASRANAPSVLRTGTTYALVVYSRFAPEATSVHRVFTRVLDWPRVRSVRH